MINFILTILNIIVFLYILIFLHVWYKKIYTIKDFIKKTNKIIIYILIYICLLFKILKDGNNLQ
jgi:hypothetical protein